MVGYPDCCEGSRQTLKLIQSEDAQFKLDKLLLLIEGTGHSAERDRALGSDARDICRS